MILIIDNYDSFTYNIAQALGLLGEQVEVVRNDAIDIKGIEAMGPEALVISPGPGRPDDSGITCQVIEFFTGKLPILGVCLGNQAIGQVHGGKVVRAAQPVHGKVSEVYHDGKGMYRGLRNPFGACRYHSLIVPEDSVKPPLKVSAYTLDGEVMGLSNPEQMLEGVQFHPESIATGQGLKIFQNFLDIYLGERRGLAKAVSA